MPNGHEIPRRSFLKFAGGGFLATFGVVLGAKVFGEVTSRQVLSEPVSVNEAQSNLHELLAADVVDLLENIQKAKEGRLSLGLAKVHNTSLIFQSFATSVFNSSNNKEGEIRVSFSQNSLSDEIICTLEISKKTIEFFASFGNIRPKVADEFEADRTLDSYVLVIRPGNSFEVLENLLSSLHLPNKDSKNEKPSYYLIESIVQTESVEIPVSEISSKSLKESIFQNNDLTEEDWKRCFWTIAVISDQSPFTSYSTGQKTLMITRSITRKLSMRNVDGSIQPLSAVNENANEKVFFPTIDSIKKYIQDRESAVDAEEAK